MSKLELKHLAPYLPYGLEFYVFNDPKFERKYLQNYPNGQSRVKITVSNIEDKIFNCGYKPILHPLSDLTEEIEVNGERFVPIYVLENIDNRIDLEKVMYGLGDILLMTKANGYDEFRFDTIHSIFQKLFEWHFDVFGLIEQELAIDINTLKL